MKIAAIYLAAPAGSFKGRVETKAGVRTLTLEDRWVRIENGHMDGTYVLLVPLNNVAGVEMEIVPLRRVDMRGDD